MKKQVVERYLKDESVEGLSAELGIAKSSIYEWISELNSNTAEQTKIMRSKLNKQQQIIEILKAVNCTISFPLKQKLTELKKLYGQYDNHTLCEALDVDRATFLNYIKRRKGDDAWFVQKRTELHEIIQEIYDDSNGIYGAEKIAALIKKRGISVSNRLVRELMKELGLKSLRQNAIRRDEYGDYCVAMGLYYGLDWDRFLIEMNDGTQFTVKMCDSKGYADDGEGKYHWFGGEGNGKCIIEFIYDDNSLPSCVAYSHMLTMYNG